MHVAMAQRKPRHEIIPSIRVEYFPRTHVTEVSGSVNVNAPPEAFLKIIDPEYWPKPQFEGLSRDYDSPFEKCYRVEVDDRGRVVFDDRGNPKQDDSKRDESRRRSTPDKFLLYEYARWDMVGGIMSSYRNLLNICLEEKFGKDDGLLEKFSCTYSLRRCLTSQILSSTIKGGLDVDDGYFRVTSLGKGENLSRVEVVKKLRHTDSTPYTTTPAGPLDYGHMMNYIAPQLLGMWIDAQLTFIGQLCNKVDDWTDVRAAAA